LVDLSRLPEDAILIIFDLKVKREKNHLSHHVLALLWGGRGDSEIHTIRRFKLHSTRDKATISSVAEPRHFA
jgi:hypothetical protein